jgi:tetratricopeptide (TPR) repeat protein
MKRVATAAVLLALSTIFGAIAYQSAVRDRDYHELLTRGDAALQDDQTFDAIETYTTAIYLRPDSMLAYLRRGETYRRRGDLETAARDFQKAADLDPSATRPLEALGDVRYTQERFRRAAEIYAMRLRVDDRSPIVTQKLATALYRDGNIVGALAALEQAATLGNRPPEAFYLLGICLREQQRLPEAAGAFERAVALSPGLIPAREELADIYGALGRRADRLAQLEMLAVLDQEHVERHVAVGLAHAREGRIELALESLRTALDRAPDQSPIYGAIGRVWLDRSQPRDDRAPLHKALEALERVATSNGATSEVLTLYARALLLDNRADAAERVLLDATERFPVNPSAFLEYAAVAERHHHLEAARDALIRYGAIAADDRDAPQRAWRIGTLSLRMNEPAIAVMWLQRAVVAMPDDPRLLAALGDAESRSGGHPRDDGVSGPPTVRVR